jgi:hypothetical protein
MMKSLLIISLFFIPSLSQAEFKGGNELKSSCNATSSNVEQAICLGYVMAVADIYINKQICLPKNVTAGQAKDVVLKYLNGYPERLHFSADSLVLDSLKNTFPCR